MKTFNLLLGLALGLIIGLLTSLSAILFGMLYFVTDQKKSKPDSQYKSSPRGRPAKDPFPEFPETPWGEEMTEATYTDRKLKNLILKRKEPAALIAEGGEGCIAPQEVLDILNVGDPYILEVKGFNRIAGFMVDGKWYGRKSDQEIEAEDKKLIEDARRRHIDYVESKREEWTKREAELPYWAKEILQSHRLAAANRGEDFDTQYMGWGYTLTALELAVLYASDENLMTRSKAPTYFELPEHILQFHEKNGLSGNQDDWAWYVARNHAKTSVAAE